MTNIVPSEQASAKRLQSTVTSPIRNAYYWTLDTHGCLGSLYFWPSMNDAIVPNGR
jgi:hypothetical protein